MYKHAATRLNAHEYVYLQHSGLGMGSPLSPVGDGVIWARYVDDFIVRSTQRSGPREQA